MKGVFFLTVLNFLVLGSAFGQALVTDRPGQTYSSIAVPKGMLQIESGLQLSFIDDGGLQYRSAFLPSNLFKYGVINGLELRLEMNLIKDQVLSGNNVLTKNLGFSNLALGAKVNILEGSGWTPRMAVLAHITLPTGNSDIASDHFGFFTVASFSNPLSEKLGLSYNLGYGHPGTGKGFMVYSLNLGISFFDKLSGFLETYGEWFDFETFTASFDFGLAYLIFENFQVDILYGTGLNHTMNFFGGGLSWRFSQ